ncbi:MAG: metal ABC transporter substrate-binding protein [Candidatus Syntrophosphaera sp.]
MRGLIPSLLILVLLLSLFACGGSARKEERLVIASIYPYEILVKQMVGEDFRVQTLIPPNASPHTYSPKPREIEDLHNAELVIANGFGLETNLRQAFDSVGDKLVLVQDLLNLPEEEGANPHVWLSPPLMQQLVILLNDRLQTAFPEHSEVIANNSVDLVAQIAALSAQIARERSTFARTPLITFHDSFHHFVRDYGIEYLGSVQSSAGREPSPRELARIGDLIRENGVRAIYVEPQMDKKSAAALANEFDLQIIELDPLGHTFKPETYMDIILNNWEGMKLGWQARNETPANY